MNTAAIAELYEKHLMRTYRPQPVAFARGQGCRLWDGEGREYLDFVAGIAVMATGHSHPKVVEAVQRQAAQLIHTSNLYFIEAQARLAERLTSLCFADRVFFSNSGAEANEAALKLARKWAQQQGCGNGVVAALQSFHGRTIGSLTATGQEKYRKSFLPLVPGFSYVPLGDLDALAAAMEGGVCAVILEPIQGEGGVNVPADDYLPAVRQLCDRHGALLIFDEVQTGLGRTGKWFAHEHWGVTPDVMTLAKALGSGLPIGACLATEKAAIFEPGDHASTFGGNPLCCAAALATLEVIEEEGLVEAAAQRGAFLEGLLRERLGSHPAFREVRGMGLLQALVFDPERVKAPELVAGALQQGLILNALGEDRLRLAPPLVVSEAECRQAVDIIAGLFP
ncbi:MAG TPA: acetylornithine transaminase [Armatimonadota bacterium]|jgi:predicted acetylornithine/succinylornithine family transaminase